MEPDHAPLAVQLVALVDDHVRVTDPLTATSGAEVVRLTVGGGLPPELPPLLPPPPPPPHPDRVISKHVQAIALKEKFFCVTID